MTLFCYRVQFLSNDFHYGMTLVQNCSSKLVPTYKWQDAYKALKQEAGQSLQELSFVYLILTGKVDKKVFYFNFGSIFIYL